MDNQQQSEKCKHESAAPIGDDGNTEFLRCLSCGSVVIIQNEVRLAIPPARKAG